LDQHIHAGFVRNRRFLIAVSVGLACVNVLGLTFKRVNILGNEADIANSGSVYLLAWIVWGWAYAQYVVWFIDVHAWPDFLRAVNAHCRGTLGHKATTADPPAWASEQVRESLVPQLGQALVSGPDTIIRYMRVYAGNPDEERRRDPRTVNIHLRASVLLRDRRGYVDSPATVRYEVPVAESEWTRQIWLSTLWMIVTRRFTLEYFAPFAIGLTPVGMELHDHWQQLVGHF
jgi:hypothetical protein